MLQDFEKFDCTIDKDGIALIDLNNEFYKIDTKRGYWPVLREGVYWEKKDGVRIKKIPVYSTKVELVEFKEDWVQKRVEVFEGNIHRSYDFEWISYDELLPNDAFDLKKTVKERFSKPKPSQKEDK
jgi:hypothetical protein